MALVQKEREHYRSVLKTCEENLKKVFSAGEQTQVPPPFQKIPAKRMILQQEYFCPRICAT